MVMAQVNIFQGTAGLTQERKLNVTKIFLRFFPTTETFLSPDKSKLRCDRCVRRWLRRCVREWVRGWGVNCGKIGLRRLLTACSSQNSSHYFSFSIFFAVSCLKTSFLISFCLPSSCVTFHRLTLSFLIFFI